MNEGRRDPLRVDAQRAEEIREGWLGVEVVCRQEARQAIKERPTSRVAVAAIAAIFFTGRVIL